MSTERWQSLIDQQIQDAIGNGKMSNHPGAGKPMNLRRNPYEPQEMWLANKIMADNDIAPEWISLGKELETLKDNLLDAIKQSVAEYQQGIADLQRVAVGQQLRFRENAEQRWRAAQNNLRALTERYNEGVRSFNIKAPSAIPRRKLFNLDTALNVAING
jgi:hypothetical protein